MNAKSVYEGAIPFNKGRKLFRLTSIAAFVWALLSPFFLHFDYVYTWGEAWAGYACFAIGWIFTPIWYANLLLFFMWSQLKSEPRPLLWPGFVALGLALGMWVPPLSPGPPLEGAWTWIASILLALAGSLLARSQSLEPTG